MFRSILYLLLFTLVISVVKAVVGIITKAVHQSTDSSSGAGPRPARPQAGELRKDPVCGTFVSVASALQKKASGETYYFCSPACRDKFPS